MKKIILITISLIFFLNNQSSLCDLYRIKLKDKGPGKFYYGSEKWLSAKGTLTEKSIQRRFKNIKDSSLLISEMDVPIYSDYKTKIALKISKIELELKWMNYLLVEADSTQIEEVKLFDFVTNVQKAKKKPDQFNLAKVVQPETSLFNEFLLPNYGQRESFFGYSYYQNNSITAIPLQQMGISGDGITIGLLDNGFRYKGNNKIKSNTIIAEYDFIFHDSTTANQELDHWSQDLHGTPVFSVMSAFYPDSLIGISPNSYFYLAKTENMYSEQQSEQDYYVAGVEWLENQGCDIISASLGYRQMNDSLESYNSNELTGSSSLVANYINLASQLGVLCFISAGNSGPSPESLGTPADADSAITVGAINFNNEEIAPFSSRGPNAKGRLKPDISCQGVAVAAVDVSNNIVFETGTSLSCPLAAGGVALLYSAMQNKTAYQIKKLLFENCSNSNNPNNDIGHGIPNLFEAFTKVDIAFGGVVAYPMNEIIRVLVYINNSKINSSNNIMINFKDVWEKYPLTQTENDFEYYIDFHKSKFKKDSAICYFIAKNENDSLRKPFDYSKYISISASKPLIPFGIDSLKLPFYSTINQFDNVGLYLESEVIKKGENLTIINYNSAPFGHIKISNINGSTVYEQTNINQGRNYINTEKFTSGVYFIQFINCNRRTNKKIVII